jgi:hypothetical protein
MSKFTKGAPVRQVVPVIEGVVSGYSVDQELGTVQVLVEWEDVNGERHSRYFAESELQAIPPV